MSDYRNPNYALPARRKGLSVGMHLVWVVLSLLSFGLAIPLWIGHALIVQALYNAKNRIEDGYQQQKDSEAYGRVADGPIVAVARFTARHRVLIKVLVIAVVFAAFVTVTNWL